MPAAVGWHPALSSTQEQLCRHMETHDGLNMGYDKRQECKLQSIGQDLGQDGQQERCRQRHVAVPLRSRQAERRRAQALPICCRQAPHQLLGCDVRACQHGWQRAPKAGALPRDALPKLICQRLAGDDVGIEGLEVKCHLLFQLSERPHCGSSWRTLRPEAGSSRRATASPSWEKLRQYSAQSQGCCPSSFGCKVQRYVARRFQKVRILRQGRAPRPPAGTE